MRKFTRRNHYMDSPKNRNERPETRPTPGRGENTDNTKNQRKQPFPHKSPYNKKTQTNKTQTNKTHKTPKTQKRDVCNDRTALMPEVSRSGSAHRITPAIIQRPSSLHHPSNKHRGSRTCIPIEQLLRQNTRI